MEIDRLKEELVTEIKDLAEDIARSNTFVGLLSNEIKFRSLHEKFINLKFLERKHIGLEIFDQPVPDKDESSWEAEETFDDEESIVYNFEDDHQEPLTVEETENFNDEIFSEEQAEPEEEILLDEVIEEETVEFQEETEEEVFMEEASEPEPSQFFDPVDDYADLVPSKKDYPKIQLDFNDRIAFLNQLFDGDSESMELVINTLNHMESLSDSRAYLKDLKTEMDWRYQDEYLERLEELIAKRFE